MYISHSSKIPGQPRDELQWEEEEEELTTVFLYLSQNLTLSKPSKYNYFENIVYQCQDLRVKGVLYFCGLFFAESQSFVSYSSKYLGI